MIEEILGSLALEVPALWKLENLFELDEPFRTSAILNPHSGFWIGPEPPLANGRHNSPAGSEGATPTALQKEKTSCALPLEWDKGIRMNE